LQGNLTEAEQSFSDVQDRIAQSTAELADVGSRLETARSEEARLRQTAAQLTQEAADATSSAAEIEAQVQTAREAQAAAQSQLAELRAGQAEFQEQRESLEMVIAELETQRTTLQSQIESAQTQRDELQTQTTSLADTLSQQGEEVAALEAEIAELQSQGDVAAQASIEGLAPGRYIAQGQGGRVLTFLFGEDESFAAWPRLVLDASSVEPAMSGTYSVGDTSLVIESIDGESSVETPIECEFAPGAGGLTLEGDCVLSGLTLRQLR
jgi:predicted nuclease with TOPRIM domain